MNREIQDIRDHIRAIWVGIGLIAVVVGWTAVSGVSRGRQLDAVAEKHESVKSEIYNLSYRVANVLTRDDLRRVWARLDKLEGVSYDGED